MTDNIHPEGRGRWWLFISQAFVALNDNIAKFSLFGLVTAVMLTKEDAETARSIITACLIVPFIVLASVAGWMSDRYSKRRIISTMLAMQGVGAAVLIVGAMHESVHLAVGAFAILAVQTTFFAPAKRGIVKELVGHHRLGISVGLMEMLNLMGILLGALLGGKLFDVFYGNSGDAWYALMLVGVVLVGLTVLSWSLFQPTPETGVRGAQKFRVGLLTSHFSDLRYLWKQDSLRRTTLGWTWFYGVGIVALLALTQYNQSRFGNEPGTASATGMQMGIMGLGILVGNLATGLLCRRRIDLGLIPIGALGVGMCLVGLAVAIHFEATLWLNISLVAVGFASAVFYVPVQSHLQDVVEPSHRGRVLAAAAIIMNLAQLALTALQWIVGTYLGIDPKWQFVMLAVSGLWAAWLGARMMPGALMLTVLRGLCAFVYRRRVHGAENLPEEGGVLLIANHTSYADAVMLALSSPRPVRFLGAAKFLKSPRMRWLYKATGTLPVSTDNASDAIKRGIEALKAGEVLCIFPEGQISRIGGLVTFKRGFELMARKAGVPVVPVWLDCLWGSVFSFRGGKAFNKMPSRLPYPVHVHFGKAMSEKKITTEQARSELLDLGERAFRMRPELRWHLGWAAVKSLKARSSKEVVIDCMEERRVLKGGVLLVLSLLLGDKLRQTLKDKRVGIVLPPGAGAVIANLAVTLAGKTPVNLNFTLGKSAIESCLERADVKTIITAAPVRKKLPDFPWTDDLIDISRQLKSFSKLSIMFQLLLVKLLPASWLAQMHHVPMQGGDDEATVLFSSGSVGEPKGIVLTHRNILGNVEQIDHYGVLRPTDALMGTLPKFHSFGCTVTVWYPLLKSLRLVTTPSPLEVGKIADIIEREQVTVHLGTPTLYRPYLKKVEPKKLASLRAAVAGAEKTPEGFHDKWEERFPNCAYLEGYGLTETSPVVAVNLPDVKDEKTGQVTPGTRRGSVGRLFPGMAVRVRNSETGEIQSVYESGTLCFKGVNVFGGYLKDEEKTKEVFDEDGFFITGDIGRVDEDGFVYIEGRSSRFSKVGGEMVSHGAVEQALARVLDVEESEQPVLAVASRPDEARGEALVLVTTLDLTAGDLKTKLSASETEDLPSLWIPREIKKVDALPMLGSGKLDLKALSNLAKER